MQKNKVMIITPILPVNLTNFHENAYEIIGYPYQALITMYILHGIHHRYNL